MPHLARGDGKEGGVRKLLLLFLFAVPLAFSSCRQEAPKSTPVPPVVTDTKPLGDGLKVIGFAILGASIVLTLGRLLK